jgi:proline iminopeptidase
MSAMDADRQSDPLEPREHYVPVANGALFCRAIGAGRPIIVLHGGPDFDHTYLLPELDRLADGYRLIYYDQRGRGRSAANTRPADVSIRSEVADVDSLRAYYELESVALLGHSWGGLLALEYALRHPHRVTHLILMNTAPAAAADYHLFRQARLARSAADGEWLKARAAAADFQAGDPAAVAAYYRVHFRAALRRPEHLDSVIARLRASFTPEGVLLARAVEDRLMADTWLVDGYDLRPALQRLHAPALILHGEHDFIPLECAAHVAEALPDAHLVVLRDTGHFAYLENPDGVRRKIDDFFAQG